MEGVRIVRSQCAAPTLLARSPSAATGQPLPALASEQPAAGEAWAFCCRLAFAALVVLALPSKEAAADPVSGRPVEVKVRIDDGAVVIDASFHVAATPEEAWEVLTGFDRIGEFVTNIRFSKVLTRAGNRLVVEQRGAASMGLLSYAFASVREVDLYPCLEIRSRLISGTFKRLDGVTLLTLEGSGTRIENHGVSVPDVWIPPVVGLIFIEAETRKQFEEMRNEIQRIRADRLKAVESATR